MSASVEKGYAKFQVLILFSKFILERRYLAWQFKTPLPHSRVPGLVSCSGF